MANLKEIRLRITSVTSTRQITSAMKMVSAAKLKKGQDALMKLRPYASKLHQILGNLSASIEGNLQNPYVGEREVKKVMVVFYSSNRGLCGAFNSNIGKAVIGVAENDFPKLFAGGNVHFLAIGRKAADLLRFRKIMIQGQAHALFDTLKFDKVSEVAEMLMKQYASGEYDKIILVYNQFKNAAVQVLTQEQFLPVLTTPQGNAMPTDYIYEPSREEIVNELIPRSLKIQFYKGLLESNAAEHGARMIAMHKATDNATDMIRDLKLTYNKARQASITKEILEVVGGAEALNG